MRDIVKLEESDVARLEQKLAANPDDFPTRLKLLAYHQRADRAGHQDDRAKRVQLVLSLWDAATKAHPRDAAVEWNAASFFEVLDSGLYMDYLEATAAADPNHPFALLPLAHLYALSILDERPLAARAQAGLDASRNVWVLGNAANMFQSRYNETLQRGTPDARAAELAERYFLRQGSRSEPRPVPQPSANGAPRNVIRGVFLAKGETGWAVLCSVNNPIDHQGIDDAFLEKASTTWYFHDGKWLRLQGAD